MNKCPTSERTSETPDITSAGESMVMMVPTHRGVPTGKTAYMPTVAGAESNVACYASALGLKASWASRVGDDPFGQLILRELGARGVNTDLVKIDPTRPTGIAFKDRSKIPTVVQYFRDGSAASRLNRDDAEEIHAKGAPMLHLSGITPALSVSAAEFTRAAIQTCPANTEISFDVNWRAKLWPTREPSEIACSANASDIVFVGLDEAQDLWHLNTPQRVRDAFPEPRLIVVKQGAEGATVFDRERAHIVPALQVDVVEQVGAGDAFAGGFLAGLHRGLSPAKAARLGVISASTALISTDDVGQLPSDEAIDQLLSLEDSEWRRHRYTESGKGEGGPVVPNC